MKKKQREQILLEPAQKERLQAEADAAGVPKTEIVRRALDEYFESDDDEWDRQMKRDLKAGRLDDILAKARKQYREGKYTEL
jgi:predicted DNA-binding protein